MRAAVLHQPGEPLRIEELELEDPRPGEIRVRVAAAGVCHSHYRYMTGDLPCRLPIVVGHEGSGTVEAVGDGVESVGPGDLVTTVDLPGLLGLYLAGRLPLDELLGDDYPLEGVNEAYAALAQGAIGRAVLLP